MLMFFELAGICESRGGGWKLLLLNIISQSLQVVL